MLSLFSIHHSFLSGANTITYLRQMNYDKQRLKSKSWQIPVNRKGTVKKINLGASQCMQDTVDTVNCQNVNCVSKYDRYPICKTEKANCTTENRVRDRLLSRVFLFVCLLLCEVSVRQLAATWDPRRFTLMVLCSCLRTNRQILSK